MIYLAKHYSDHFSCYTKGYSVLWVFLSGYEKYGCFYIRKWNRLIVVKYGSGMFSLLEEIVINLFIP